jgi:2-iminobutanoate/2-iminopropanoate deaminase
VRPEHVTAGAGSTFGGGGQIFPDAVRFGDLVILSGRAPVDPATLKVREGGFEEQARSVLNDIGGVLEAAGSRWDHVLRVECFLADAADFPAWNRIWSEHFTPPRPARTTVVTGFAVPDMLIELQVIAGVVSEP